MSLRRIAVLFSKETKQGTRNFLFIFAIVTPVVVSFVLSLVFGDLFSQTPNLGFVTEADSQMVRLATELDSVSTREYATEAELKDAVERGALDMGVVLPAEFDTQVSQGDMAALKAYIWGESLAQNRAILGVTIASLIREMTGQEIPLDIVVTPLGDTEAIPWEDRLLPFLVLMAVVIGGTMVPASSLVNEKQEGTLTALTITPSTLSEVFLAKGVLGILISTLMGVLILVLNQAFVSERLLLVVVLALGATLAASFGVLLGALTKDVTTLFATIKGIGLLLYAPALVYLFPTLPQWIARIFPTYYIIGPVIEIVQNGGTWSDVALDVFVLVLLILGLMALLLVLAQRSRRVAYAQ